MATQNTKKWYQSKTLWLNLVGLIIVVVEYAGKLNTPVLTPEVTTTVLAVLNIILRFNGNVPIERKIV